MRDRPYTRTEWLVVKLAPVATAALAIGIAALFGG